MSSKILLDGESYTKLLQDIQKIVAQELKARFDTLVPGDFLHDLTGRERDEYLSQRQVARVLGVSPDQVSYLVRKGLLPVNENRKIAKKAFLDILSSRLKVVKYETGTGETRVRIVVD